MLDQLVDQDFLLVEDEGSTASYAFRHAVSQEVTYRLLSFAQRVSLHKTIAGVIERQHSEWLEPYYSQLAQHWERANEKDHAIRYLELSAKQALRSYANRDAIRYIQRAFRLIEGTPIADSDARRSEWEEILGDANNELADYEEAFLHYARAMALMKETSPRWRAGRLARVTKNLALQIRLRLWNPRPDTHSTIDRRKLQRTAHIRERLAERHFFLNELLGGARRNLVGSQSGRALRRCHRDHQRLQRFGVGSWNVGTARRRPLLLRSRARALPARWAVCPSSLGRIFSLRFSAMGWANGNSRNAARDRRSGSIVSSGIAPAGTRR